VLGEITKRRKEPLPPELLVINKNRRVRRGHAGPGCVTRLQGSVAVSARTGAGIAELAEVIADRLPRPEVVLEALVPYAPWRARLPRPTPMARCWRRSTSRTAPGCWCGSDRISRPFLRQYETNGSPASETSP